MSENFWEKDIVSNEAKPEPQNFWDKDIVDNQPNKPVAPTANTVIDANGNKLKEGLGDYTLAFGKGIADPVALGHWQNQFNSSISQLADLVEEQNKDDQGLISDEMESGITMDRQARLAFRKDRLIQIQNDIKEAQAGVARNNINNPGAAQKFLIGSENLAKIAIPSVLAGVATGGASVPIQMAVGSAVGGLTMGLSGYNDSLAQSLIERAQAMGNASAAYKAPIGSTRDYTGITQGNIDVIDPARMQQIMADKESGNASELVKQPNYTNSTGNAFDYSAGKGLDVSKIEDMQKIMANKGFVDDRGLTALKVGGVDATIGALFPVLPGLAGRAVGQTLLKNGVNFMPLTNTTNTALLGKHLTETAAVGGLGAAQTIANNYIKDKPLTENLGETFANLMALHYGPRVLKYVAQNAGNIGKTKVNDGVNGTKINPEGSVDVETVKPFDPKTALPGAEPAAPVVEPTPVAPEGPIVTPQATPAAEPVQTSPSSVFTPQAPTTPVQPSPVVQPGYAPPRPKTSDYDTNAMGGDAVRAYNDAVNQWDNDFGMTHRADGSPLSQGSTLIPGANDAPSAPKHEYKLEGFEASNKTVSERPNPRFSLTDYDKWNSMYGHSHKPDGSPKTADEIDKERDFNEAYAYVERKNRSKDLPKSELTQLALKALESGEFKSLRKRTIPAAQIPAVKPAPVQPAAPVQQTTQTVNTEQPAQPATLADQPSPNLPPRAVNNVEPRPGFDLQNGETRSELKERRKAWDEKYGKMRRGDRSHNDDGTVYQPTVFDETVQAVFNHPLTQMDDQNFLIEAVGTSTHANINENVRILLDNGWVWDADQSRMVNPKNPSESPANGVSRLNNSTPVSTPEPQVVAPTPSVQAPAVEAPKTEPVSQIKTPYFKGDAGEYTGNTQEIGGKTYYEIRLTEGHLKGQTKLISETPTTEAPKPIVEAPKPVEAPVAPQPELTLESQPIKAQEPAQVAETPKPVEQPKAVVPKPEPQGIKDARSQLAKLEASGAGESNQAAARRKYIAKWESENGINTAEAEMKKGDFNLSGESATEVKDQPVDTTGDMVPDVKEPAYVAQARTQLAKLEKSGKEPRQQETLRETIAKYEADKKAKAEVAPEPAPVETKPKRKRMPKPAPVAGEPPEVTAAKARQEANKLRASDSRLLDQYQNDQRLLNDQFDDPEFDITKVSDEAQDEFSKKVSILDDEGMATDTMKKIAAYFGKMNEIKAVKAENHGNIIKDIRSSISDNKIALPTLPAVYNAKGLETLAQFKNLFPLGTFRNPPGTDVKRAKRRDFDHIRDMKSRADDMISELAQSLAEKGWTQLDPTNVSNPMDVLIGLLNDASLGNPTIPDVQGLGASVDTSNPRLYTPVEPAQGDNPEQSQNNNPFAVIGLTAASSLSTMDVIGIASAIAGSSDRVLPGLNPIVANMHLIAEDTGSSTALAVANMFGQRDGNTPAGANETYDSERNANSRIFKGDLAKAFEPLAKLSEEQIQAKNETLAAAMSGEITLTGPDAEVVKRMQAMADEIHAYAKEAGVDLGYVEDYGMPHSIDVEKVMGDEEGFLAAATEAYRKNNPLRIKKLTDQMAKINDKWNATGKITAEQMKVYEQLKTERDELAVAKPEVQAEEYLNAISFGSEGGDMTLGLIMKGEATNTNNANFLKGRIFEPPARKILRSYFNNDPRHAWNNYINRMTKIAEFSRRFGHDGSKWAVMVKQMRKEGMTNRQITDVRNMVLDSLGALNPRPTAAHALANSLLGLSNMSKLKTTAGTIFLESQSNALAGNITDSVVAPVIMLHNFMAHVGELTPSQRATFKKYLGFELNTETGSMELARICGMIDAVGVHDILENSAHNIENASDIRGDTKMEKAARGISGATARLARSFGLPSAENSKRVTATRMAVNRLSQHVNELLNDNMLARAYEKANPGAINPFTVKNEARVRLRRAGISDANSADFCKWWQEAIASGDFNQRIADRKDPMAAIARKAIRMEAGRTTVTTGRTNKIGGKENPLIGQDTFGGKASMSFLIYPGTFREQIFKPFAGDVRDAYRGYSTDGKNNTYYSKYERARMIFRSAGLAAMAATAAVWIAIRTWMNGDDDAVAKLEATHPLKKVQHDITYTGVTGGKSEFVSRAEKGQFIPVLDEAARLTRDLNVHDNASNTKERAVAKETTRSIVVPALEGLTSTYMPTPVAAVVNQVLARKEFRDAAVDLTAGEKQPTGHGVAPRPDVPKPPRPAKPGQ